MPIKREDFDGPQLNKIYTIGDNKIEFDGFTFNKNNLTQNPLLALMAIIAIDPTEKQKELMNKLEIIFEDDFGKRVFPKECQHIYEADGEPCIKCGKKLTED